MIARAKDAAQHRRPGQPLLAGGLDYALVGRRVRRAIRALQVNPQQHLFAEDTHVSRAPDTRASQIRRPSVTPNRTAANPRIRLTSRLSIASRPAPSSANL